MKPDTVSTECSDPAGSAESPASTAATPPQLAEQLARIIARALAADYRAALLKPSTAGSL